MRVFDICTRFGGEEFAVVMPGSAAEDAARIAERIRQRVQNSNSAEPGLASLKVTVSIGLAVSRPDMWPSSDLDWRGGHALYQAKRAGKETACGRQAPQKGEAGPKRAALHNGRRSADKEARSKTFCEELHHYAPACAIVSVPRTDTGRASMQSSPERGLLLIEARHSPPRRCWLIFESAARTQAQGPDPRGDRCRQKKSSRS